MLVTWSKFTHICTVYMRGKYSDAKFPLQVGQQKLIKSTGFSPSNAIGEGALLRDTEYSDVCVSYRPVRQDTGCRHHRMHETVISEQLRLTSVAWESLCTAQAHRPCLKKQAVISTTTTNLIIFSKQAASAHFQK